MAGSSLIAEEMREKIARNYVASEREARFTLFHVVTFLCILFVAAGAVLVDYMIVTEFWTRALANEFMELPGALGTSVAFKSAQVLFATVAAHILYESMGRFGRAIFVQIVFALALLMLLGVGFLLATMSLPNGLAATGESGVGESLGSALSGLGIGTGGEAETARVSGELAAMREWQPLLWLGSLGIVFLVVTGVASLCLHYAAEALRRVFHARDFRHRRTDMERLAALEAEYDGNRHDLAEMEGAENRRHLLWTGLMRECRAYEQGLHEARHAAPASSLPPSRRLIGRRGEEQAMASAQAAANLAREDRLRACESARDVGRYERLFDEWWERRSRNAMKAGPTLSGGIREPAAELLPPEHGRQEGRSPLMSLRRRIVIERAAE